MGLKLIGEVALDGSGFERGLTRMAGSVKGFIASAFGFYGVEQALRKTSPRLPDGLFQVPLQAAHPRAVVLLGDLQRRVTEQHRHRFE